MAKNISAALKKIYVTVLYPFIAIYLKKERSYNHKGFKLKIFPGIFHPAFFFSTKYLFSFIDSQPIQQKECLDLGCGSGLLSLLMLRKKGKVTAIDIQDLAIQNTLFNFEKNKPQFNYVITLVKSDLFDNLPLKHFDFVVINPPYFFAEVTTEYENAWYCGEHGNYFEKLFFQLGHYIHSTSDVYMVLAENCDLKKIEKIASKHGHQMEIVDQKKIWWELNYIFKIKPLVYCNE
jgi:release factor glutamine methyltransferase